MAIVSVHDFRLTSFPHHHFTPNRRTFPDYAENIGRVADAVASKYANLTVIDVGANIGDTAAVIRSYVMAPILCIEGVDEYSKFLEENASQLGGISLEKVFLDTVTSILRGRWTMINGSANFRPDESASTEIRFESLETVLRRNQCFYDSKLIKIDTDGMDGRIILGALDWLTHTHPILFWEFDLATDKEAKGPGLAVLDALFEIGYYYVMVWDNFGRYLRLLNCENLAAWEQFLPEYPGGVGKPFPDVCAFHVDDNDLCVKFNAMEREREWVVIQNPEPASEED